MSEMTSELLEIVSTIGRVPKDKLDLDDDLAGKHGIDSMRRIEILIEVEKKFGISVPDEEAQLLRTFRDFVRTVEKYSDMKSKKSG